MTKNKQKSKYFSASVVYFILIVGFILIRLASFYDLLDFAGDYGTYLLNLILQVGLMFLMPLFLYSYFIKSKPKETLSNFGFKKIKPSAIAIAIIIGIIVYVLNIGVSSFFSFILALLGYEKLPTTSTATEYTVLLLIINLIFTGVLPAICEEITHRGMLIDGFSKLGYKKAIIFSALLFGLTHLNVDQFFYATIIGLFLGFLTMITGNIIPAMIIHFMNNAINVLVSYALATNSSFAQVYNSIFDSITTNNFFVVVSVLFFVISTLIALILFLVYKLFKETAIAEINHLAEQETKKQLRAQLMGEYPQVLKPNFTDIPMKVIKGNKAFHVYVSPKSLRHPIKQIYFPALKEKAFFYSSMLTGIFITIATYIWGII